MLQFVVQWRLLIFIAAVALVPFASSDVGVQAQDLAAVVVAPNPEVTATAIVTNASASSAPVAATVSSQATESTTKPVIQAMTTNSTPKAVEAAVTPVGTDAATIITPASTSAANGTVTSVAPIAAQVNKDTLTKLLPPTAPSIAQVTSEARATTLLETTSNEVDSSMRGSEDGGAANASSLSPASDSATKAIAGTVNESFSAMTIVLSILGGICLVTVMCLVFVFWRNRRREDRDLKTPVSSNATTKAYPAASMPSIIAPTARDLSFWKTGESTFTSRDLPLTASARARLNTEYDMTNRHSNDTGHNSSTQVSLAFGKTNLSSEQSFSVRGYSEFSIHDAVGVESRTSAMTNDRDSASDGYSTGDRYSNSMCGKYSASSRLSSDPGRRSSSWSPLQASKILDMYRNSSMSSTTSSVVARNDTSELPVHLDQCLSTKTSMNASRTDVLNWCSVIDSPTHIGRYTSLSLDSDRISIERESYEL